MLFQTLLFMCCYVLFISITIFFITIFLTKKYKNKFKSFYSLFFNLSKKDTFLLSTTFLNLLVVLYFLINIKSFLSIGIYAILAINIYSCFFAFNIHIIISDITYTFVSIMLLWVLNVVNNYSIYIITNSLTIILKVMLMILIIIYSLFVLIRKEEIIFGKYLIRRK